MFNPVIATIYQVCIFVHSCYYLSMKKIILDLIRSIFPKFFLIISFASIFCRFWNHIGLQNRAKLVQKLIPKSIKKLIDFLIDF